MSTMYSKPLTVVQILPALQSGGVERGTLEVGKYLVGLGHRSIVISAGGRMVPQLLAEGSEHVTMSIGRKSLLTLALIPKLIRTLREQHVDIVHVRSRFPAWIVKLALKCMATSQRPKWITTVHGQYSVNAYSRIMTEGDEVIVISNTIQAYVCANYPVDVAKLHLNYRGVDPVQFPYRYQPSTTWLDAWYAQFPETKGKFIITLPARVTRWKGQEDLCQILAELKQAIPNIHGLLVGEVKSDKVDFFNELKDKVRTLGIAQHITFTGHRSDLRDIMAISNVVLSLSHAPEAFGRVTLEALSMGVPVLAYAHGGVDEQLAVVFPQGRVQPKNYLEASRRLLAWFASPPIVEPTTHFSLNAMLENTLTVYQTALAKKNVRA
jgi:glycosyltransferase involved in cell wall biosynthesis